MQEPQLPSYIHADAKEVSLALLAKDVAKRLACGGRGAAEVRSTTLNPKPNPDPSPNSDPNPNLTRSRSITSSRLSTGISSWPWCVHAMHTQTATTSPNASPPRLPALPPARKLCRLSTGSRPVLAQELTPPFEPDFDVGKPTRQKIPKEQADGPQLDYFCHMVDYMKTSMSMRGTWPLKPEDQAIFDDFDFVSNKVFEEELARIANAPSPF